MRYGVRKQKIYQLFTCMWLCSDEVEEKPRLHTLHLNGLLELGITRNNNESG